MIVRKNLSVEKGEAVLFDEIRYFFYITTRTDLTPAEVVELANGRCNQESVIEQLKNGVNAMRVPVNDLLSNWAYMVIAEWRLLKLAAVEADRPPVLERTPFLWRAAGLGRRGV